MITPELAELSGQIEGAIGVLKVGLSVVGGLLLVLLGLVGYVFTKLDRKVESQGVAQHKAATALTTVTGRVIVLETWRGEHERRHAMEQK